MKSHTADSRCQLWNEKRKKVCNIQYFINPTMRNTGKCNLSAQMLHYVEPCLRLVTGGEEVRGAGASEALLPLSPYKHGIMHAFERFCH